MPFRNRTRNRRNSKVSPHSFSMVPKTEIPRSSFLVEHSHKTTMDADKLVPIFVDEVLPGDTISLRMSTFTRMQTLLNPVMDSLYLDSFFFFVPNRLIWSLWEYFIAGDNQANTDAPIPPRFVWSELDRKPCDILDYLGLPPVNRYANIDRTSCMPWLAYNKIYNDWFRDQNLCRQVTDKVDGSAVEITFKPESVHDFNFRVHRRAKKHDYFTSCLPWPVRENNGPDLGTMFKIKTDRTGPTFTNLGKENDVTYKMHRSDSLVQGMTKDWYYDYFKVIKGTAPAGGLSNTDITFADNTGLQLVAGPNSINSLRYAFAIHRALERDSRSGVRYTEVIESHFGVRSPDARLQRAEYLGGGTSRIAIHPIAQTSATQGGTTPTTPLGTLGATATAATNEHGFAHSFTEHGFIIGIVNIRSDVTYQSQFHRMWNRRHRFDYYFPAFAHLGEQPVGRYEIDYGSTTDDGIVFGYQEAWAEYRYLPNRISGWLNSNASAPLDSWHFAQKLSDIDNDPKLNQDFIEARTPLNRVLAVKRNPYDGNINFLFDSFFKIRKTRCMPMYSVPGYIDRF